ncbi:MAG: NCS2 family permease [Sphaerochaetaceae bacterium]
MAQIAGNNQSSIVRPGEGVGVKDFFELKSKDSNVRREIVAGFTTFFTMAYIIFVNPDMLALTGMSWGGVFIATCLSATIGTLIMALFANVPYAVAPGMGLNAIFTYTVCLGAGFTWQEALAMVFICGIINIIITVTKLRKAIVKSIPIGLQNAIGGAIGLFIAYLGMNNAGFISFGATPGMAPFGDPSVVLSLIGLFIMIVLMVLQVKGAILIGIIAATVIGIPMGVTVLPQSILSSGETFSGFREVAFSFFGKPGFGTLFSHGSQIPFVLITIFSMSLADTFDSIGTFIGTGRKSHIFDEEDEKALEGAGFKSRLDKALVADSFATSIGACLGTSNATTYVESAAGIAAGGRTGLTSLTTAFLFLLCLPFAGLFGMVPGAATAPALIVVGILMAEPFAEINWKNFSEAVPAFFTVAVMSFTYGITNGIAAGFIMYCVVKLATRKAKEIHPIIAVASILFIIDFVMKATGA